MGRSRYKIIENGQPYFVTCTIINWMPIFSNKEIVEIVVNSLRFLQEENRLTIFGFIILENHLHVIASGENLAKDISNFKSFTGRESP